MNNSIKIKKLEVMDVIITAMSLYKNNFSIFFKLNAIGVLILFVTDNFTRLQGIIDIIELDILIGFIGLVIAYVGIYYNIRVGIALILAIKDRYSNRKVGIKDSYKRAKSYTWNYIRAMLLLGLMMIIPMAIIMLGFSRIESLPLKFITIIAGIIPLAYLIVKYGLALYVRIFKPGIRNYFVYSRKLIENHFWEALIILFVPFIVQAPNYIIRIFIDESKLGMINGFIYSNLGLLLTLFAGPFITGVMVITYLKLDKK